jgi:hypothetical protein
MDCVNSIKRKRGPRSTVNEVVAHMWLSLKRIVRRVADFFFSLFRELSTDKLPTMVSTVLCNISRGIVELISLINSIMTTESEVLP